VRWTFNRNAEGSGDSTDIVLRGDNGDFLAVWCQDDLAAIAMLRFAVQGVRS
jgi:hypothetical protein